MPIIILLDSSLSMYRSVADSSGESRTRKHLAHIGINTFLDYLSIHCKLEFVSLITFSSVYKQLVPFTRDYAKIKEELSTYENSSMSLLDVGLEGVSQCVLQEWGPSTQCQVILMTDGSIRTGKKSLLNHVDIYKKAVEQSLLSESQIIHGFSNLPFPFKFLCSFYVVSLSSTNVDAYHEESAQLYNELIELNESRGEYFCIDKCSTEKNIHDILLNEKSVHEMFLGLAEKHFSPCIQNLQCGNLNCSVFIFPSPDCLRETISSDGGGPGLEICGYLDIGDISSPPCISRHLILPVPSNKDIASIKADLITSEVLENDESKDIVDKNPTFTVLLHGSLKVEGMVAIVQLKENQYGMLYSYADSKKKSNLVLSLFQPGLGAVPWLGKLNNLGPSRDAETTNPYFENKSPFPVGPEERRSYSQSSIVWINNSGLHTDVQKMLRNARKLPEKQVQFYKELNRIRKFALSIGFYELFEALACLLERECTMLASNTHPEAALQMTHVASLLRSAQIVFDASQPLVLLQTNFGGE